jgi:rhodanese-related sulfurtransferase
LFGSQPEAPVLHRLLAIYCLLVVTLCGCGRATKTDTVPPAGNRPVKQIDVDLKPFVGDLIRNLPSDWHQIAPGDLTISNAFLVDVRQPEQYSKGFIPRAVNVPLPELAVSLNQLPARNRNIVLVCDTGHRSAIGMAILQMLGYSKTKSLKGGLKAWELAKLPVVTAPVLKPALSAPPSVNASLQEQLDEYLHHIAQDGWGRTDAQGLAEDQSRKSPYELGEFDLLDQGRSVVLDFDQPEEFAKSKIATAINIPIRGLVESLETMPLNMLVNYG